ncbi:uncharacterized protein [Diadema setosum]|uniref:uncharacterized protein n=1 Tax=Diadema setosum TaxID=31175 RepID=UPI003B3B25ED
MASRHAIEECDEKNNFYHRRCTYQTSFDTPSISLTCLLSEFKPNASLFWTTESGERLNSVDSRQTTLPDNTYERFETITVSVKHGTEPTFMCIAFGDSLNGTAIKEITLLPLSGCGWNPIWRRPGPHRLRQFEEEEDLMLRSVPISPSLTKEQVQTCKEELKEYYRLSRRRVTVDPLNFMERVNLDDIYTNLSLIDQSDMSKTPITYEDLLGIGDCGNLSKRILIQGEGGVGKTTLCAKIAWDWYQGRILNDMDMVIVIPLREVTEDKSIGSIVKRCLCDSNAATPDQIDSYILANLDKILLVFDGFDEFQGKLEAKSRSVVVCILELEIYKSCKVIVTTRPWRSHDFKLRKTLAEAYTFISVEGFNKENLATYIKAYFRLGNNSLAAESLISFMEENDIIRKNMAPFPIYCAMLCLMWNDFNEDRRKEMKKMQTFSELFREIISFLKAHFASKICENLQSQTIDEQLTKAGSAIQNISEIALNGLLHKKLSFPEEQFRGCQDDMETCCKVGVLTMERAVTTGKRRRDVNTKSLVVSTVSFPHKLFQEYVAGLYISNIYANDRARYEELKLILLPRYQEFRYLLYFVSALGKELGLDIVDGLIKCISRDYCVDVAFECHTEEAARAVGERWEEYRLSQNMSEHTKSGVVFMVHCNQVRSLYLDRVDCGKILSRYLAEGMCSSRALREVTLTHSQIHTDFYKIVAYQASTCQIQDLSFSISSLNQHQFSTGYDVALWVCTNPNLSTFSVKCDNLDCNFFSTAAATASSCQVQDLNLSFKSWNIGTKHLSSTGADLAKWMLTMPSLSIFSVECPYLHTKFLSTACASALSCQIRDLKLSFDSWISGSKLRSSMGGDLALWVFTMPSLSSFSLTCPYLDGNANFLSAAAASASSCKIQHLTLNIRVLDDKGLHQSSAGEDLAQWVCSMTRLVSFSFQCYQLPDVFFATVATLAPSYQISRFSMAIFSGRISELAATNLAQFLCRMPQLECADITCRDLPGIFFTKIASETSNCKVNMKTK